MKSNSARGVGRRASQSHSSQNHTHRFTQTPGPNTGRTQGAHIQTETHRKRRQAANLDRRARTPRIHTTPRAPKPTDRRPVDLVVHVLLESLPHRNSAAVMLSFLRDERSWFEGNTRVGWSHVAQ